MMKKLMITLAAMTVLLAAGNVMANFTPVGEPFEANSWGQRWQTDGAATDHIQIKMLNPDVLHVPSFSWFSAAGWSEIFNDGEIAVAEGPRVVGVLKFDMLYVGDQTNVFTFLIQGYDGPTLNSADDAAITWAPGWRYAASGWDVGRIECTIPAPGAVLLAGMGAGLVGWMRRRRTL